MPNKWLSRLNTARAWLFATALIVIGVVWIVGL
jgi:hypothetical protein